MWAFMVIENRLHGTTFLGLELVVAPVWGAIFGAMVGTVVGALWVFVVRPLRGLKIAWLMVVVAVSGPSIAFFVSNPMVGLLALINLPVLIVVLARIARNQEQRKSQPDRSNTGRTPDHQHLEEIAGSAIRLSDWGIPSSWMARRDEMGEPPRDCVRRS
jgi:hypothetical protein